MPSMKCVTCGIGFFFRRWGRQMFQMQTKCISVLRPTVDVDVADTTAKSSLYNHVTFLVTTNFIKNLKHDTR